MICLSSDMVVGVCNGNPAAQIDTQTERQRDTGSVNEYY